MLRRTLIWVVRSCSNSARDTPSGPEARWRRYLGILPRTARQAESRFSGAAINSSNFVVMVILTFLPLQIRCMHQYNMPAIQEKDPFACASIGQVDQASLLACLAYRPAHGGGRKPPHRHHPLARHDAACAGIQKLL